MAGPELMAGPKLFAFGSGIVHGRRRTMQSYQPKGPVMKTFSTQAGRTVALAAVAVAAFAGASAAQARDNVEFSITVGSPGYVQQSPVWTQPQPVYSQPVPVYSQPVTVYSQPVTVYSQPVPVYSQPVPVYVRPAPVYSVPAQVYVAPQPVYVQRGGWSNRYGYEREERREEYRHEHHWYRDGRRGPYGDFDGDGVPNRFDRAPGNPYRR
jgi:hypothetical protein